MSVSTPPLFFCERRVDAVHRVVSTAVVVPHVGTDRVACDVHTSVVPTGIAALKVGGRDTPPAYEYVAKRTTFGEPVVE